MSPVVCSFGLPGSDLSSLGYRARPAPIDPQSPRPTQGPVVGVAPDSHQMRHMRGRASPTTNTGPGPDYKQRTPPFGLGGARKPPRKPEGGEGRGPSAGQGALSEASLRAPALAAPLLQPGAPWEELGPCRRVAWPVPRGPCGGAQKHGRRGSLLPLPQLASPGTGRCIASVHRPCVDR